MTVTEKLKEVVDELRKELGEVKEQVKQLLPAKRSEDELGLRQESRDHPIAALQRETNRLFDDFLRGSWGPLPSSLLTSGDRLEVGWPEIDIDESDREVRIRADLAGMGREDVDLSVADGVLTIRGEKKREEEDVGRHHYRRERFYGTFSRSVQVPADVDLERIEAKMKKGVLSISMPKLKGKGTRGRRISIGE